MRTALFLVVGLVCCGVPDAHPMGNFSVNHYSHLQFHAGTAELTYVLDLAEIPTFELLNAWRIDWKDQPLLAARCGEQAREWLGSLELVEKGHRLPLRATSVSATAQEGAGGMPTLRVRITAEAPLEAGLVTFEDRNYPGRAGWKEIVVGARQTDLTAELTHYPTDPAISPPQDLTAQAVWRPEPATTHLARAPQALPTHDVKPLAVASFSQQQPIAPGTVVRGDYLSRLLRRPDIGWELALFGLLAAFGLGAVHAMSPGHGKTIVAAYLVGSRSTWNHAALLGFVVTFTHTFTVFLLGLGVLFFQQYVIPEKIIPALGVISGLSIVSVGALLLYRRARKLLDGAHAHHHHHHEHDHNHGYDHHHEHHHEHDHHHDHDHHPAHTHSHGGHTHSHTPEGKLTLGGLIALGVSGGLVPCPSALILMLSAIALGRPALGLLLLTAFSAGLAMVLMSIGFLVVYAAHLLPKGSAVAGRPAFRLVPVFSAVVVICLGLAMTAVSAGWIQAPRFL